MSDGTAATPVLVAPMYPAQPGRCAVCGDPLAWVSETGPDRIHAWSGRLGLPERPYDHAAAVRNVPGSNE
ncbi:hypothetical protein [Phytohabitans rumicis]|uniref:Uncharacterized protein n=1 Tax=Phytohabitans rumicis TaxID=1076125 RepID=A0A6V8KWV5_9ACTN|nr:hypothetical protein [Phytohabitans rumicis]GFJ87870.1 hypothetical protein Prum_015120 [Phytohabitans rumicis]